MLGPGVPGDPVARDAHIVRALVVIDVDSMVAARERVVVDPDAFRVISAGIKSKGVAGST